MAKRTESASAQLVAPKVRKPVLRAECNRILRGCNRIAEDLQKISGTRNGTFCLLLNSRVSPTGRANNSKVFPDGHRIQGSRLTPAAEALLAKVAAREQEETRPGQAEACTTNYRPPCGHCSGLVVEFIPIENGVKCPRCGRIWQEALR